jgi:hypothetical protein
MTPERLGAQRRVHLEARIEAPDLLVGERQMVRGRLAGEADSGLLGSSDGVHRLTGREVLDMDPGTLVGRQRGVAGDHRRLGDRRDAGQAQRCRDRSLVHDAPEVWLVRAGGSGEVVVLFVERDLSTDQPLIGKRASQHSCVPDRQAVVGEPGSSVIAQLGHLG